MPTITLRRTRAEVLHFNARKEGPEGDQILAVDLKLHARRVPAAVLHALVIAEPLPGQEASDGDGVRRWDVVDALFDPIEGNPRFRNFPSLNFSEIEFDGHFVAIDDLPFRRVRAKKFVATLKPEQTVDLLFSVTVYPDDHDAESMLRRLAEAVWVRLEPEQGDLFDALVAAASAEKRGEPRLTVLHDLSPEEIEAFAAPAGGEAEAAWSEDPLWVADFDAATARLKASLSEVDHVSAESLVTEFKAPPLIAASMMVELQKAGLIGPTEADGWAPVLHAALNEEAPTVASAVLGRPVAPGREKAAQVVAAIRGDRPRTVFHRASVRAEASGDSTPHATERVSIVGMSVKEAKEYVGTITETESLRWLLQFEQRTSVRKTIEARIESLTRAAGEMPVGESAELPLGTGGGGDASMLDAEGQPIERDFEIPKS